MELKLIVAPKPAIEAHKSGQIDGSQSFSEVILRVKLNQPDVNHNIGLLEASLGEIQRELPFFNLALKANLIKDQFWLTYIDSLIQLDQIAETQPLFGQAKGNVASGEAFEQLEQRLNELNGKQVAADPKLMVRTK